MIISRTPFRVSFVGGGTDLKSYYTINDGKVLSCAIDKYLYVVVKRQLGIVEHKFRVNWSKVEFADEIDEIQHPIVREALRLLDIDFAIEITTFSEIPANTGNIIRLCANTGAKLHLIGPLVFELNNAKMRRAGLDYHDLCSFSFHSSWDKFIA